MIKILYKYNCCGCAACVQVCPQQCISFNEDEQGFRYPLVDENCCIDCGLCEKVCPVINQADVKKPLNVYAAKNPSDEIRLKSSSGGIFTLLAETIINEGGVVFGAQFDENWEVQHAYAETKEELEVFRGSKYLQSRIGNTYKQAKEFLKAGRKVLYSGTSCQIAGLKKFLRKEYDNLITVDVVCHGAPSPLVWRRYLENIKKCPKCTAVNNIICSSKDKNPVITGVSFRDKSTGWKKYSFVLRGKCESEEDKNLVCSSVQTGDKGNVLLQETFDRNLFMQIFLKNLCLRPSCSICPAKKGKCGSDITLADYWGISAINPDWDDDKGTSLVLLNSENGCNIWNHLDVNYVSTTYEEGLRYNPSLEHSVHFTRYVPAFWEIFYSKEENALKKLLKSLEPNFFQRNLFLFKGIAIKILRLFHLR